MRQSDFYWLLYWTNDSRVDLVYWDEHYDPRGEGVYGVA